jgi:hypothetical protein
MTDVLGFSDDLLFLFVNAFLIFFQLVLTSGAKKSSLPVSIVLPDVLMTLVRWMDGEDAQEEISEKWDAFFEDDKASAEDPGMFSVSSSSVPTSTG